MKITKDNYNELKYKDLDNNFAKVWHVNELADEVTTISANTYTPPYKSYVVSMYWDSGIGLGTPQIYEMYNNTEMTITWHDTNVSTFQLTGLTGITNDNTFIIANFWGDDNASACLYSYQINSGALSIFVTDGLGNTISKIGDGTSWKAHIEIRIYN